MELDELKKQLFKKDSATPGDRPKPPAEFDLGRASIQEIPAQDKPSWGKEEAGKSFSLTMKQKKLGALWAIIFLAISVVVGGIVYWRWLNFFDKNEVALDIFGPERIISGEEINYVVRIKNNTRVALQGAKLEFLLPADSIFPDNYEVSKQGDYNLIIKNIGDIAAGLDFQETFKIRVLGDKDTEQKFLAKLNYKPSNSSAKFLNEKEFLSTIISVPLVLNFTLPEKIVSGQVLDFSLRYINASDATFSNSRLKIDYPDGFIFDSALPSPSEGNDVWDLAEIGNSEEGRIIIKGTISGNQGENKVFKAQVGMMQNEEFIAFAQTINSPQVSASPLAIEQEIIDPVDGYIVPGGSIAYKLKYRNTTDVAIGSVVITLKIDSQAVDFSEVNSYGGFFSSSDNMITWNSSSLPELESLAAGAESFLRFSLKIKDKLPVVNLSDKNFVVTTSAKINSFNVPLVLTGTRLAGENQMTVKVSSRLVLGMKGYYNDRLLPNSGPLPPQVGQETTYTVYWQLINVSNDLTNVVVESYLFPYMRWKGNIYPKDEDIKYDEATGKVTWKISRLTAGTGILSPVRQIAFQVGLVASLDQVGNTVVIVKSVRASARDSFTEKNISVSVPELNSDMPDDPMVGFLNGRVKN